MGPGKNHLCVSIQTLVMKHTNQLHEGASGWKWMTIKDQIFRPIQLQYSKSILMEFLVAIARAE